jgi:hypothetical protein
MCFDAEDLEPLPGGVESGLGRLENPGTALLSLSFLLCEYYMVGRAAEGSLCNSVWGGGSGQAKGVDLKGLSGGAGHLSTGFSKPVFPVMGNERREYGGGVDTSTCREAGASHECPGGLPRWAWDPSWAPSFLS